MTHRYIKIGITAVVLVLGFAGLRACGDNPDKHRAHLPPSWRSLSMHFQWRGQWHELTLPEGVQHQKIEDDA